MTRAGEADVGVLLLAGQRVAGHLGVGEVSVLELARLGDRVTEEGAEDHPEGVDAGQQRPGVADDAEDQEAVAAVIQEPDDVVLGEPA